MKNFLGRVLLFCFFLSCEQESTTTNRQSYKQFDATTCQSNQENKRADFGQLQEIDSNNASNYTFSGTCEREGSDVKLYIEGHPLDTQPVCNRGEWQISANISGIVSKRRNVQVAVSQTGSGGLLCERVKNHFICPDGYIAVSQRDGYTSDDFCVMKYEAKVRSESDLGSTYHRKLVKAESRANGVLITRVSEQDAIKYCEENGAGYSLISNDEWQTIARNIEEVDVNWSKGNRDIENDNLLKVGNISGIKASSDEKSIDDKRWRKHDRYHKLLNGEYIWDFAGNLTEMVRHDISSLPAQYRDYVYNMPLELKDLFGPERDYSVFDARERHRGFGGLGFIQAESFKGAVLRGGTAGNRTVGTGIFSTDTTADPERLNFQTRVGFRCVYYP